MRYLHIFWHCWELLRCFITFELGFIDSLNTVLFIFPRSFSRSAAADRLNSKLHNSETNEVLGFFFSEECFAVVNGLVFRSITMN